MVNNFYKFKISTITKKLQLQKLLFLQMTKETAEIIVNEAIDLWQEHGGPTGLVTEPPKQK